MNKENYETYQLSDFILDESFQAWVQGKHDPFWDHFLDEYPEKNNVFKEARLMVEALSVSEQKLSVTEKENYLAAIYLKAEQREKSRDKSPYLLPYWKYAASLTALILLSGLVYYFFLSTSFQYYETAYQETQRFQLADGTEVVLNANSTLKVLPDLQDKDVREVWLDGEAFFKVNQLMQEGDSSTFVVHTPNLDVQVLGTHFNVKSRDGNTRVMLEEGSVKVANVNTRENLLMSPGEAIELNEREGKIKKELAKESKELAWQHNYFIFENESLADVAAEIYQYYGIQVRFEEAEMRDYIFTAEVSRENLPLLQTLIEEAFDMRIKREGNAMIFQKTNQDSF
ncbi:transmembrane sensor [Catalinimonas alkaloidigena]|uniref:FecR family protein n=1 Tax=Catalinimonas alkaloidigena TaxID=1075417 RepID=UPI0024073136|nr:FecR domain-containing protein [Catalinimonas alkaloidigena]MDF9796608.1 transmembrane sensor [Catalinimonas alkaloidigena]